MKLHKSLLYLIGSVVLIAFGSCIEDGYTTSPSDQPVFSTDTLDLGTIFTGDPSPTSRFVVHNPASKQLSISEIGLSGPDAQYFRINVDGMSGERFSDVDIRGKDSIFVFVEATLPESSSAKALDYEAKVDFSTNGVTRSVVVTAGGQNVVRHRGTVLNGNVRFTAEKPYQIYDSLTVAEGSVLTLEAGSRLCFHDKAMLIVRGTLIAEGTPEAPVVLEGDRQGNVVGDISFEIMSRQWQGLFILPSSHGNSLSHLIMRNTVQGLYIEGDPSVDYSAEPQLNLHNCRLRNSGDLVLESYHTAIRATGCEFAEGSNGLVFLNGGKHSFSHCTFANYYLFTALGGPAIQLSHLGEEMDDDGSGLPWLEAEFSNSIIYGNGSELSHGDLAGSNVFFRRCLLKSEGSDDDNFLDCVWGEDPMYYTVREEYLFDYRLKPESPAAEAAYEALTPAEAEYDFYGLRRSAPTALGAYVFDPNCSPGSEE